MPKRDLSKEDLHTLLRGEPLPPAPLTPSHGVRYGDGSRYGSRARYGRQLGDGVIVGDGSIAGAEPKDGAK